MCGAMEQNHIFLIAVMAEIQIGIVLGIIASLDYTVNPVQHVHVQCITIVRLYMYMHVHMHFTH